MCCPRDVPLPANAVLEKSRVPDFALAWLDCEFGGLNPREHDITEIAVIVTDDRLVEAGSKEWKIRARPERISAEAARISGYFCRHIQC